MCHDTGILSREKTRGSKFMSNSFYLSKRKFLVFKILTKSSDAQVEDVNYSDLPVLQTEDQVLVYTKSQSHIGEVEILGLPLSRFET